MNINLSSLVSKDKIFIDEVLSYSDEYLQTSDIKKLDNVKVKGYFYLDGANQYACMLEVEGQMKLLDSVSLEPVDYSFNFIIDENITDKLEKNQNSLDIMEFLWENIVLEVPIRYTLCDAEGLKGDNWKVKSGKEDSIDPRMQKLYDYYKGGE